MTSKALALVSLILLATFAARPAEAGRPRMVVLDQDVVAVTHDPKFEGWANLSLLRSVSGEALLLDTRVGRPIAVTALGFQVPSSGVFASYVESPDGVIWAAIAWSDRLRLLAYDQGDTATHEHGGWYVSDPGSVELGITAVLIGLLDTPVATLAVHADGEIYAWIDGALVPIELLDDGWHPSP